MLSNKNFGWAAYPASYKDKVSLPDQYEKYEFAGYIIEYLPRPDFGRDKARGIKKDRFIIQDGIIFNREELEKKAGLDRTGDNDILALLGSLYQKDETFFKDQDGTFAGLILEKGDKEPLIYTNHTGDRPVYYFEGPDGLWAAQNYNRLIDILREAGFKLEADPEAFRAMVAFGSMQDYRTWVKGIKRLTAGHFFKGTLKIYHRFDTSRPTWDLGEDEWIEKIDETFRSCLAKQLAKDKEYGYKSIIDISGGLDSRMLAIVAKDLGYKDAILLSYSSMGSDEEKVAQEMALLTPYPFYFMGLDDGNFMKDIEGLVRSNFGAAYYIGITGGKRLLSSLNPDLFGMEHTGLLGDVADGGYLDGPDWNYYHSNKNIDPGPIHEQRKKSYPNFETFYFYTRGCLWGLSSMLTRRNYFESFSPFMHKDFLELSHRIPVDIRYPDGIFRKWLIKKYPEAADVPYADGMVKISWPLWKRKFYKSFIYRLKGLRRRFNKIFLPNSKWRDSRSMNPLQRYYDQEGEIRKILEEERLAGLERIKDIDQLQDIYNYFSQPRPFFELAAFLTAAKAFEIYTDT